MRKFHSTLPLSLSVTTLILRHDNRCSTNDPETWEQIDGLKTLAVGIWRNGTTGGKIAAVKVIQRLIQTQTMGSADPRVRDLPIFSVN
jgi:hypothetical protein